MIKPRIFITGGTGFIGSHLVDKLVEEGYPLTVFSRESSSIRFIESHIKKGKVRLIRGDIENKEEITKAMKDCEILMHNAAMVGDWGKFEDFYKANVKGTENILEAARKNKIKKIIFTSSNAVLGEENCPLAKLESAPYKPIYLYFLY
ncbi:MAG: SDR family NAD(P)-dependent oxidoreductase, partial [Nanoarchaeota archaeon]|nr:SDR family NAD(P)-dependent oxidoreductase [Nanoarchaeota archaeon]